MYQIEHLQQEMELAPHVSGYKSNSDFFLDGRSADVAIVFVLTSADAIAVVNFISETSDCFGIFNCLQCWW